MSLFEERLTSHPLRDAIAQLRTAIGALDDAARRRANEIEPQGTVERALAVATWVEGLLDLAEPMLVPVGPLDAMSTAFIGAAEAFPQIASDETWVPSINNNLDSVIGPAQTLVAASAPLHEVTEEVSKRVGRAISGRTGALTRQLNGVQRALGDLRQATDEARDAATAADEERAAGLQQRLEELQHAIEVERQRVDQLVSNVQTEHQQAQSARQSEHVEAQQARASAFDEAMSKANADVGSLIEQVNENAARHREALDAQADGLITDLRDRGAEAVRHLSDVEDKVDDIYEVITKKGTAGAFHDEAKKQAKAADIWRWIAVAFGIGAVAVAVLAAFIIDPDDFGWEQLVAKLAVTVGLGAIAAYAGRQSGRHREREELAKQLELDLTAIGPFLEEVGSEEKKNEARTAFIQRWMSSRTTRSAALDGQVVGIPAREIVGIIERVVRGNGQ